MKPEAERYAAYIACKERGHYRQEMAEEERQYTCIWCDVKYFYEYIIHESNVPEKPKD